MLGCVIQSLIVGALAGFAALLLVTAFGLVGVGIVLLALAAGGLFVGYVVLTAGPYDDSESEAADA